MEQATARPGLAQRAKRKAKRLIYTFVFGTFWLVIATIIFMPFGTDSVFWNIIQGLTYMAIVDHLWRQSSRF